MHFTVGDFVLDLAQNSVEADARAIEVAIDEGADGLRVRVADDGRGMSASERDRALDPLANSGAKHPGRKVGFGLPFIQQAVELAGGTFSLESVLGRGTEVRFFFPSNSVDSPPLGDVGQLFSALISLAGNAEMRLRRTRSRDGLKYEITKSELEAAVGDLGSAASLALVRQFLASQEEG